MEKTMHNKNFNNRNSGLKPVGHSQGGRSFSGHLSFHRGASQPRFVVGKGNRFGNYGRNSSGFGGRSRGERIDPAKFINKAVITEEAEHFKPEHLFQDFKIDDHLKRSIVAKGYAVPTPIQDRAIPHILQGADIVGIANTGTGKTGAFLIPLIQKVRLGKKEQVLIVAPTRELALQIDQELKEFVSGIKSGPKIFSVCCVGGASIGPQLSALRYEYSFIIGTPGRLKDLIERKRIILSEFKTIVLDEADRMLDMGFVHDMRFLMSGMPKDRQTLFFSATLSSDVERFIKEFLRSPVRISVKTRDTSQNVEQDVVREGSGSNKLSILHDLLSQKEFSKVLIFGRTKHGVEKLSKVLAEKGFKAESIHGNKN